MPLDTQPLTAIVPAAGIGQRFPGFRPKQYLSLGERTVIEQTLQVLLLQEAIGHIIVVLHPNDNYFHTLPIASHLRILTAVGGERRMDSVLHGLQQLPSVGWVLVHDAVRPCLHPDDLQRLLASREHHLEGAVLATPVRDSLKQAGPQRKITSSVLRDALWQALTPQLFPVNLLQNCLQRAVADDIEVTDEASALTYCGYQPTLIPGRGDNIKVTYPEDLIMAACLLTQREG
ncbi:MAG: 2-C-methyl-D-erythritol 4-phosphate cytidylyltransferase [Candidatus Symbiodolus clandestinus]